MKHISKLLFLPLFLLTSCTISFEKSSSVWERPTTETSPTEESNNDSTKKSSEDSTIQSDDSLSDGSTASKELPDTVTVFSINDVHGSLELDEENRELGLARLEYAIKQDKDYDEDTSIILNGGDAWQGGYLAYKDKTMTDKILSEMGIEFLTLGNHEFDWGIKAIQDNQAVAPYPYLGCNILDKNAERASFVKGSTIIEKGGVKYGIIGAIGADQESSISEGLLEDYYFSEDLNLIQKEVDFLQEQDCDLILLSLHDSVDSPYTLSIANTFTSDAIQGIFGAHSHRFENAKIGNHNLPYVQGGSNAKGYCKMTFNMKSKQATNTYYTNAYSSYCDIDENDPVLNSNIQSIIDEASQQFQPDTSLCYFNGDFRRYYELNQFVPESMILAAQKQGLGSTHGGNELLAIHNLGGIRSNIASGEGTMRKLYKTFPFENTVEYATNILGSDINKMLEYSASCPTIYASDYYCFMTESRTALDLSKTYDIVTISYVTGTSYFRNAVNNTNVYPLYPDKTAYYTLDLISDRISNPAGQTFYASDYR